MTETDTITIKVNKEYCDACEDIHGDFKCPFLQEDEGCRSTSYWCRMYGHYLEHIDYNVHRHEKCKKEWKS